MKVAVIGLGTIGMKLVEYLMEKRIETTAYNWRNIEEKRKKFDEAIEKKVKYEKIGLADYEMMKGLVTFTDSLDDLVEADILVDSSVEDYGTKRELYSGLLAKYPGKVLASTTSSLDLNILASCFDETRFVGLHFFNPPTKMKLIELAFLPATSQETRLAVNALLHRFDDKQVVEIPPVQGYIVNRLLFVLLNAAFDYHDKTGIDTKTIDEAMKAGTNMPMGPFELSDYIGNDITLDILKSFHSALGEEVYRPSRVVEDAVRTGLLGRKSKKGFYQY